MSGFAEGRRYKNGTMNLKAIAKNGDSVLFERFNGDGTAYDYIIGTGCSFDGDTVSWCWGSYLMHHDLDRAMKALRRYYE